LTTRTPLSKFGAEVVSSARATIRAGAAPRAPRGVDRHAEEGAIAAGCADVASSASPGTAGGRRARRSTVTTLPAGRQLAQPRSTSASVIREQILTERVLRASL
jgi:hypothetical protein